MNRYLTFSLAISVTLSTLAMPQRAAWRPHAGRAAESSLTWTNEDMQQFNKVPGLISVVGEPTNEASRDITKASPQLSTDDAASYAEHAATLRARLEAEQADLRKFTQALDDTRELKSTTGGVNLTEGDIGITPEATIDILQNRIRETQSKLDELEDLARHNGIPPGALRGQSQDFAGHDADGRR